MVLVCSRLTSSRVPYGLPQNLGLPGTHVHRDTPRAGEQFVTADKRAFSVDFVEWRYDLGEVHLFCTEYPTKRGT